MSFGTDTLVNNDITVAEITHISPFGFWILCDDTEYFVDFVEYPLFKSATIQQILDFTTDFFGDFHWPLLDIDIERDSLMHPENYPLQYRN